jgi:hypothetical protein
MNKKRFSDPKENGETRTISKKQKVENEGELARIRIGHNKEIILRLLNHENNKHIRFDQNSKVFMFKATENGSEKKVPGITRSLSYAFWPNYQYTRSRYSRGTGVSSARRGIERGMIVHQQMEDYSNMTIAEFKKKHTILHPFTKSLIVYLRCNKLIPIRSEFTIFDSEINKATKIDMLCANEEMEIVAIELKTGMDDYISRGNDSIKGPLEGEITNCPKNQALIQILMSSIILEYRYNICIKGLYVLNVNMSGVYPYEVPQLIRRKSASLYNHFRENISSNREKKKKRIKK